MGNRRADRGKESAKSKDPQPEKKEENEAPANGGGVSNWLASAEGVGWMQFFVITNAIILLLTTGLPRIWESIDYFTGSTGK